MKKLLIICLVTIAGNVYAAACYPTKEECIVAIAGNNECDGPSKLECRLQCVQSCDGCLNYICSFGYTLEGDTCYPDYTKQLPVDTDDTGYLFKELSPCAAQCRSGTSCT